MSLTSQLVLTSDSELWVEGTSTIHDWRCDADEFVGTITVDTDGKGALTAITSTDVTVAARQIDCDSGKMNKKTQKALQTSDHSFIRYTLSSAEIGTASQDGTIPVTATGQLTIAGAERTVDMALRADPQGDGTFQFHGELPLLMTDFGVEPPTALLGTLKTGDRIVIKFNVTAQAGAS